jgi:RNA polymerase sigma-70 factor (ECF subfamily)
MEEFSQVCQMYYNRVYRFLLSLTGSAQQAEDLTQETFYRALLHIGQYREDGHMFAWLCTIGKNAWLSECRRQKRAAAQEPTQDAGPSAEEAIVERERQENLRRAILTLPDEYQEVVILHVYGGVPLREIAARRGKSESWSKVTYYRARQMLRKRLEGFL